MSDGEATQPGPQDVKPDVKPESEHLNLKVKAQDGNVVFFKAKKTTPLRKLMAAYCNKSSIDVDSVVFTFDGNRIRGEQTPGELEMEDQDEIESSEVAEWEYPLGI